MHPLILALVLTGAAGAAAPGAIPAPADAAPAGVPGAPILAPDPAPPPAPAVPANLGAIPEPQVEARPDRNGWRHAVGLGPHSTTFFSKEGSQYTFHSASLGYLGSYGGRGVFVNGFWLLPLQARQDGHVYSTVNYYRLRRGGDLLLGWQWRWSVHGDVEAEAGPGLHGMLIYLPGKAGYRDFSALPLGFGAGAMLRWGTRAQRFSRSVTVGTYASAAYDFYDPMHADDLAHGFTFRAGVVVGLGARR